MSGPRRNVPATSDARSLSPDKYFLGTVVKEISKFTNALEDCNERSGTDCRVTFSVTILRDHWGYDPHRLAYESDHHIYATSRNIQDGTSKDTQIVPKIKAFNDQMPGRRPKSAYPSRATERVCKFAM
jgi:hypothetical protein